MQTLYLANENYDKLFKQAKFSASAFFRPRQYKRIHNHFNGMQNDPHRTKKLLFTLVYYISFFVNCKQTTKLQYSLHSSTRTHC